MQQWHNPNSGTTQTVAQPKNCPFAVGTAMELKNVTVTSDSNGI